MGGSSLDLMTHRCASSHLTFEEMHSDCTIFVVKQLSKVVMWIATCYAVDLSIFMILTSCLCPFISMLKLWLSLYTVPTITCTAVGRQHVLCHMCDDFVFEILLYSLDY